MPLIFTKFECSCVSELPIAKTQGNSEVFQSYTILRGETSTIYTTCVPTFFKYLKINTQISLEPGFCVFPWWRLILNSLLSLTWSSAFNGAVSPGWFVFSFDSIFAPCSQHPYWHVYSHLDDFISRSLEGALIKSFQSCLNDNHICLVWQFWQILCLGQEAFIHFYRCCTYLVSHYTGRRADVFLTTLLDTDVKKT